MSLLTGCISHNVIRLPGASYSGKCLLDVFIEALSSNQKSVSIISSAELELVDENASKAGMNRSRHIRELIHGNGNVDSTFAEDRANLIKQVTGVVVNVNQIARMVNTNKLLRSSDLFSIEWKLDRLLELFREVLDVWRLRKS